MADVRGASGTPAVSAFTGFQTPTPSTPIYVDTSIGDLWVLISETPVLVGGAAGGSSFILAGQAFGRHVQALPDLADAAAVLAERAFAARPSVPAAILGTAADILQSRVFRGPQFPATWS